MKSLKKYLSTILLLIITLFLVACGQEYKINRCLKIGEKYLENESYEKASEAFEKALELDKYCIKAYEGLVVAKMENEPAGDNVSRKVTNIIESLGETIITVSDHDEDFFDIHEDDIVTFYKTVSKLIKNDKELYIETLLSGTIILGTDSVIGKELNKEAPNAYLKVEAAEIELGENDDEILGFIEETKETSIEAYIAPKSEGVMTYEEFINAPLDTQVIIEAYVQAKQSWWDNTATVYLQDSEGAYFVYGMACTEEEYAKMPTGTKIKVIGYKAEWLGEIEIIDASFEFMEGHYIAFPKDVTPYLGTDEIINFQNQYVSFKNMTIEPSIDSNGNKVAYLYKWDGSGYKGDDIYFNASTNGEIFTFSVESNLCDENSFVYRDVEDLGIGDIVNMEGLLYWYDGSSPHITEIEIID